MNEEEKNVKEVKEEITETSVEQEKTNNETVSLESTDNNKKGDNKVIIIILSLVIVALLVVILILLLGGNNKNNNSINNDNNLENKENNENVNNTENTEVNTNTGNGNTDVNNDNNEQEIKTPEKINNLSNKFDKLFGDYIYLLGENDNNSLFGRVLEWRVEFVEMENPPKDNDYAYFVGQLSLSAIENEYYNLFGEKIDISKEFEGSCAKAYYDKEQNIFIQKKYGCDAGWGWFVNGYRYKYTEDNNNAYIYAAVAVHSGIEKIDILSDPDTKTVYKTIEGSDSFEIDESNYESFAKYKITFKKVGNDYFYKSVEKIEAGK